MTHVWSVDREAQAAFVALSGDANPLHTDPLAARRLPFGRVAVHGMHLALNALNALTVLDDVTPARIRATFRSPVGLGDVVTTELVRDAAPATARLSVDGRPVADIRVDLADRAPAGAAVVDLPPLPQPSAPAELAIGDLAGREGRLAIAGDVGRIAERFPNVDGLVAAELLAITRLIGMEVPGLHSLLSSFDLTVSAADPDGPPALDYRVDTVDERFSKVVVRVSGTVVSGTVVAFVRPAPADAIVDTTGVTPGEFAGVRALVVGGSRGLGATAVQLLAAGGADVRFTYHRGADDAAAIVAAAPGTAAYPLDVDSLDRLDAVTAGGWRPTLLAWFASPPIFVGARDRRSPALLDRFRTVYVDAFLATVRLLGVESLRSVLWPSSEAVEVEVPGLAEYADAKRAGESACTALAAAHPDLVVHAPRFPRLRTDQTASFVPVDAGEPAPHVLRALRVCAG